MFNPNSVKNMHRQRSMCLQQRRLQLSCNVHRAASRSPMYLQWRLHRRWTHMHAWVFI